MMAPAEMDDEELAKFLDLEAVSYNFYYIYFVICLCGLLRKL